MPLLATGDYRPDVSDYEGQATRNILNVIPRGDGYGPFPSLFGLYIARFLRRAEERSMR